MLTQASVNRRLNEGWGDLLPRWLTHTAGGSSSLAVGRGLVYSSLGLSKGLLECPRSMAASFSQDESSMTDSKAEAMMFSMTLPVVSMLLATQTNPDTIWGRTMQEWEYQKVEIIKGHHLGWLPHVIMC